TDQKVDMDGGPDQPGDEAAQMDPAEVDDSGLAANGGQIAVIAIAERPDPLGTAQTGLYQPAYIGALLLGNRSHAGQRFAGGIECSRRVADCEDFRIARH